MPMEKSIVGNGYDIECDECGEDDDVLLDYDEQLTESEAFTKYFNPNGWKTKCDKSTKTWYTYCPNCT